MGAVALAVDSQYKRVGLSELQAAADSAAHTGADQLDGTSGGLSSAVALAERVLAANDVAGHAVDVADFTIDTGIWRDGAFTTSSYAEDVNALRVTLVDVTPSWMGSLIGGPSLTLGAAAIAANDGAGQADCPLPMAMPSCAFGDLDDICFTDITVTYSPDPVDNVGWALMNADNVNANDVRNQLTSCSETDVGAVGDQVSLNNGQITSALQAVADTLNDSGSLITELWDDAQWGPVPTPQPDNSAVNNSTYGNYAIVGQLPLFDDDGFCDGGGKFNQKDLDVNGFATVGIYDVSTKGKDKVVRMRVLCDVEVVGAGGGVQSGTWSPPVVVR